MTDPLPVAVVGAGNMGSNHIRVYDESPNAALVEIVEPDPDRAASIREEYEIPVYDSHHEITQADAASITAPTHRHRDISRELIERDIDLLIEKPLSNSVQEAEEIVRLAQENNVILQAGHIEQFNPAIDVLKDLLADSDIIAIESHRVSPFRDHLSDANVIFDLMVHDIDIIESIVQSDIVEINSFGSTPTSTELDHGIAMFQYESGTLASAVASHVTPGRLRELTVTTEDAFIQVNYQKQELTVQRQSRDETTTILNQFGYRTESVTETPFIQTQEPLELELEHFISCVKNRSKPRVDGEQGLRAVELAARISDQIQS